MSDEDESNVEQFSDKAQNFLSTLTPSEAEVLRKRFNIEMASRRSSTRDLEELKRIQKRIRDIEEKAHNKNAGKHQDE